MRQWLILAQSHPHLSDLDQTLILDDSDGIDTEHYYSDVDPNEEEDEESENDSTVVASLDVVVDETKPTEDQAINMQQTMGTTGKQINEYPGIGVSTPSLVDLTGQLTDGAMVEVTLRGPTHQDICLKDLSDVEYFSPGPVNAPQTLHLWRVTWGRSAE